MTTHELAKKLLEGPDVDLFHPSGEHCDHEPITELTLIQEKWCSPYILLDDGHYGEMQNRERQKLPGDLLDRQILEESSRLMNKLNESSVGKALLGIFHPTPKDNQWKVEP